MASYCSIHSSYSLTVTKGEISLKDTTSDRQKVAGSLADRVPAPTAVTTRPAVVIPITFRGHSYGFPLQRAGSAAGRGNPVPPWLVLSKTSKTSQGCRIWI